MTDPTTNLNYLSGNRAVLTLPGLTNTNYTIQDFVLPSLRLPVAIVPSPYYEAPFMGDKLEYSPLNVEFIVNENLSNWMEIHNWIRSLGAPEDKSEYRNRELTFIDAIITLYSSHNNPIMKVVFKDAIIEELGEIRFSEELIETETRKCSLVIKYQRYDIKI